MIIKDSIKDNLIELAKEFDLEKLIFLVQEHEKIVGNAVILTLQLILVLIKLI